MAEHFFVKMTNDILQASEQLANHLEEGITAIFKGESTEASSDTGTGAGYAADDDGEDQFEVLEEDLRHNPLQGIADSVVGDIMGGQIGPQTPMENIQAFRQAISWSEPFILCLVAIQLFIFLFSIWSSHRDRGLAPRMVLMLSIAGLVRGAEYINRWASHNWESFATQNYFDERGIFVSIMLCAPLLLDSLVMLLLFLREASQLLIAVKTAELKKQKKAAKEESTTGTTKRRSKKDQ